MANFALQPITTRTISNRTAAASAVFGKAPPLKDRLIERSVSNMLVRRLQEKRRNYLRTASRLELRGEEDAARVLRRAAERLTAITRG